jgi:hypothetical protein
MELVTVQSVYLVKRKCNTWKSVFRYENKLPLLVQQNIWPSKAWGIDRGKSTSHDDRGEGEEVISSVVGVPFNLQAAGETIATYDSSQMKIIYYRMLRPDDGGSKHI